MVVDVGDGSVSGKCSSSDRNNSRGNSSNSSNTGGGGGDRRRRRSSSSCGSTSNGSGSRSDKGGDSSDVCGFDVVVDDGFINAAADIVAATTAEVAATSGGYINILCLYQFV